MLFWDKLSTLVRISWTSSANVLLCYLFHFPGSCFSHVVSPNFFKHWVLKESHNVAPAFLDSLIHVYDSVKRVMLACWLLHMYTFVQTFFVQTERLFEPNFLLFRSFFFIHLSPKLKTSIFTQQTLSRSKTNLT